MPIRHVVILKCKEEATPESKSKAVAAINGLPEKSAAPSRSLSLETTLIPVALSRSTGDQEHKMWGRRWPRRWQSRYRHHGRLFGRRSLRCLRQGEPSLGSHHRVSRARRPLAGKCPSELPSIASPHWDNSPACFSIAASRLCSTRSTSPSSRS